MRRELFTLLPILTALAVPGLAFAGDQATPDEAKAMAIKAAEYLKSAGPEKAFPAFDATEGAWHDRDLYVFVLNSKGIMLANGTNHGLIDKVVVGMKDVDGKPFAQAIVETKDSGWVDYKWRNPATSAVEPKTTYNVRVDDYVVSVGAYAR